MYNSSYSDSSVVSLTTVMAVSLLKIDCIKTQFEKYKMRTAELLLGNVCSAGHYQTNAIVWPAVQPWVFFSPMWLIEPFVYILPAYFIYFLYRVFSCSRDFDVLLWLIIVKWPYNLIDQTITCHISLLSIKLHCLPPHCRWWCKQLPYSVNNDIILNICIKYEAFAVM